jgi:hypothetical protein
LGRTLAKEQPAVYPVTSNGLSPQAVYSGTSDLRVVNPSVVCSVTNVRGSYPKVLGDFLRIRLTRISQSIRGWGWLQPEVETATAVIAQVVNTE